MKIKEILNKNIIIARKEEKIWEVAKKMKEYNIGFIPVVDDNKVIGVITDRDIVVTAVANNNDKDETIQNYINKSIISINLEDDTTKALDLMAANKIKRLIVDDNKKLIGIISLSDILNNETNEKILKTINSIWERKDNSKIKDAEIDEFYL